MVGLVDEGRGLERLALVLGSKVDLRGPAELVVDERQELLRGICVALTSLLKQERDLNLWPIHTTMVVEMA